MRIAVVDDDKIALEHIARTLEANSLDMERRPDIQSFGTAKDFTRAAVRDTFDLVVLDWQLPDGDGITLLGWMKSFFEMPPAVIMLTNRQAEADVVEALSAGAEDFISKPYRPKELQARVMAVLRRKNAHTSLGNKAGGVIQHGNIQIDLGREAIFVNSAEIKLTRQEYRLAYQLFSQLGCPLSRSYLYEYVWGRADHPNSRTLDVHIYRVRKKLGLTAEYGWNLVSVYGYGYRLQAQGDEEAESVAG
ncbi:response regulator transcription factor [Halomonas urumqiensis]|nr:response regulator transcription factor [Halomonas urumqiensis]